MLPRVHVYFYLLTTALTVYGHESLARMVLHASTCSLYSALLTVWVRVVCIYSMFDFCHRWRLPLGKKLKKQLSVMGMSLRIGMWSPSSLTLKPTVRITLIAASRDSLNPQLSLWGFFFSSPFSDNYQADCKCYWDYKTLCHHINWPTKTEMWFWFFKKSILITFLCTHLLQKLDLLQVSETLCTLLKVLFMLPKGNLRMWVPLYYPNFPFLWWSWQIEVCK